MNPVARLMLVTTVLILAVVTAIVATFYTVVLTREQGQKNQLHIDCIVALSADMEPPQCMKVWQQLYEDGILPPPTTVP